MLNKIVYENERKMSIEFNREGPLFLYTPEGFDGLDAKVVDTSFAGQDGVTVRKVRLEKRVLTLNCYMVVDNDFQRDMLKSKLFAIFNPKLMGRMKIYTDGDLERGASNLVVIQAPVFKEDYKDANEIVKFQIQLMMPTPFFEDSSETRVDFGNVIGNFSFDLEIPEEGIEMSIKDNSLVRNIINKGDVEVPVKIVFRALSTVKNPSIYNVYTKEQVKINKTMQVGEEIIVTTHKGNKRVVSRLNGEEENIFNMLDSKSSFVWLELGDNVFRYDAEDKLEQLEVYIYYTNYYLGV